MNIPFYHIDAFTGTVFSGNPAGVCPLAAWIDDSLMQRIAAENNLSETAFCVPAGADYHIRWFSPVAEIDLCGHATLAAAHVVFSWCEPGRTSVTFHSKSGPLHVTKRGDLIELDFPARPAEPADDATRLGDALGIMPEESWAAEDYLAVYRSEEAIRNLIPDRGRLAALPLRGVIATAPGEHCDFVSRFFAPRLGILEDPVTGSSHCTLIPFWSHRLQKQTLIARQLSTRGGELTCTDHGIRVSIAGRATPYLVGTISL